VRQRKSIDILMRQNYCNTRNQTDQAREPPLVVQNKIIPVASPFTVKNLETTEDRGRGSENEMTVGLYTI